MEIIIKSKNVDESDEDTTRAKHAYREGRKKEGRASTILAPVS